MDGGDNQVPAWVAKLIIGFLHHTLSEAEGNELGDWICASDENMEVFELLTDGYEADSIEIDYVVDDLEDMCYFWRIASFIAKEVQGSLHPAEKKVLERWIGASDENRNLYRQIVHPAHRKSVVLWMQQQLNRLTSPWMLN